MRKTFIIIYYSNKQLLIKITNQNNKSEKFLTESEIRNFFDRIRNQIIEFFYVVKQVSTEKEQICTQNSASPKKGKPKGRKKF